MRDANANAADFMRMAKESIAKNIEYVAAMVDGEICFIPALIATDAKPETPDELSNEPQEDTPD